MSIEARQFQISTPERPLRAIRVHFRDAAIEINRLLSMSDAVISATAAGESHPLLTGYMDGAGKSLIFRYLNVGSGSEFENWVDAYRQPNRLLPGNAWSIRRFVYSAPPSGILGDAVLIVSPDDLPAVDLAHESGTRRKHYGVYVVDASPLKDVGSSRRAAQYVIRNSDDGMLGPLGIAYYEQADLAVKAALSHAETTIDGGITLPILPGS